MNTVIHSLPDSGEFEEPASHRAVRPTQPDGEAPNPIQPIEKDSGNNRR